MQKVLITGAGGFIGSHLASKFQREGFGVIGLDVFSGPGMLLKEFVETGVNFSYHQVDVAKDFDSLNELISRVDLVVHLAAIVGIKNYLERPFELFESNVLGSANVIKACVAHKKRLVFSSTSEIFGKNPNTPWGEDADRLLGSTEKDRWGYSSSKATIEHLLHSLRTQLDYRVVRYFNVYGPGQNPIFLVSRNIYRVLNSQTLEIFDGGLQTRCLTYIDDAVQGTFSIATENKLRHRIYNIGSEKENTISEIVAIIQKLDEKSSVSFIDTSLTYGSSYEDLARRVPSSQRITSELNWSATTSVEEGIMKFFEWAHKSTWWSN